MKPESTHSSGEAFISWFLRIAANTIIAGAFAAGMHGIFGLVHWQTWLAYPVIGGAISILGWGSERLWQLTVAHMRKHPESFKSSSTRVPFWFFAGGMGYVIGMMISKKMHLLGFYDIPVKPFFIRGGILGCLLWLLSEITRYRWRFEKFKEHA